MSNHTAGANRSPWWAVFILSIMAASECAVAQAPVGTLHNINKVGMLRTNDGVFGGTLLIGSDIDVFTGKKIEESCSYPRTSGLEALWACGYWVGAIVDGDTLVSTTYDFNLLDNSEAEPQSIDGYNLIRRSTLDPDDPRFAVAVSQEDILSEFDDTLAGTRYSGVDFLDLRRHRPLGIRFRETSYAWSFEYAEDIILFDLQISNVLDNHLEQLYFGILTSGGAGHSSENLPTISEDDVGGFLVSYPSALGCGFVDTLNVMWGADNDGDPVNGKYSDYWLPYRSQTNVSGVHLLGLPADPATAGLRLSFNWWTGIPHLVYTEDPYDFGPRKREGSRDFLTGGIGRPKGDRNRYYVLRNGEIDYPTFYTASIGFRDVTWQNPDPVAAEIISLGYGQYRLLSIGPFDLPPGGTLRIPFAVVMGEHVHHFPQNFDNLPDDPDTYAANLDFSDLAKNILWADWIYDNPGVDTDSDGYAGEFQICYSDSSLIDGSWEYSRAETTYYRGDGIPDWRAASPPPAPEFWLEPIENGIRIRFNGTRSETEPDQFSRTVDFEGYRIYFGRDEREGSLEVIASYDHHNYDKYVWNEGLGDVGLWEIQDIPMLLDTIRCLYSRRADPCADSTFDPLSFTPAQPYRHRLFPDSIFFFKTHEYNSYKLGGDHQIRKVYPDAVDPASFPRDSIPASAYTEEGNFKYYEYEFVADGLLATIPYWINVTAFDYGSPRANLPALETSKLVGAKYAYPLASGNDRISTDGPLNVYVYPNPYRIDGTYRDRGFEGRTREDRPNDRVREVHFANLPPQCTISIYSLDGDLVRAIEHDMPATDPNYPHDSWDLITRNTQRPVSGLYYWVVEAPDGRTQVGKLVLIM